MKSFVWSCAGPHAVELSVCFRNVSLNKPGKNSAAVFDDLVAVLEFYWHRSLPLWDCICVCKENVEIVLGGTWVRLGTKWASMFSGYSSFRTFQHPSFALLNMKRYRSLVVVPKIFGEIWQEWEIISKICYKSYHRKASSLGHDRVHDSGHCLTTKCTILVPQVHYRIVPVHLYPKLQWGKYRRLDEEVIFRADQHIYAGLFK